MAGQKGRSGRRPRPTALKLIEGNRGKRKLDIENEMQPTLGVPDAPDWLPPEAAAEWDRVVPELDRLNLLSEIDRASLSAYCLEWARFVEAEEHIRENGMVLLQIEKELDDGRILISRSVKNPAVTISHAAQAQMRAWCAEFGLSPSARSRVKLPGRSGDGDGKSNPAELLS